MRNVYRFHSKNTCIIVGLELFTYTKDLWYILTILVSGIVQSAKGSCLLICFANVFSKCSLDLPISSDNYLRPWTAIGILHVWVLSRLIHIDIDPLYTYIQLPGMPKLWRRSKIHTRIDAKPSSCKHCMQHSLSLSFSKCDSFLQNSYK